jgi:hypothetical protein
MLCIVSSAIATVPVDLSVKMNPHCAPPAHSSPLNLEVAEELAVAAY